MDVPCLTRKSFLFKTCALFMLFSFFFLFRFDSSEGQYWKRSSPGQHDDRPWNWKLNDVGTQLLLILLFIFFFFNFSGKFLILIEGGWGFKKLWQHLESSIKSSLSLRKFCLIRSFLWLNHDQCFKIFNKVFVALFSYKMLPVRYSIFSSEILQKNL